MQKIKGFKQIYRQRSIKALKMKLNIINHYGNTNQKYNEVYNMAIKKAAFKRIKT